LIRIKDGQGKLLLPELVRDMAVKLKRVKKSQNVRR
jgi:hypothetical protein